ncbi:MAG: hypothetical protein JWQ89_4304, partial [Devosia sp.]|nr:hypothetical protein [Devosia sp.]
LLNTNAAPTAVVVHVSVTIALATVLTGLVRLCVSALHSTSPVTPW